MLGKSPRPGFHTVTPYLVVDDLERMLRFVEDVFGATEHYRTQGGGGGTHVELRIGDSMVMIGGPDTPRHSMLFLYVEDVDAIYAAALKAGAISLMEPADDLFGEPRGAGVQDPCGNDWFFANWKDRPGAPPAA